MNSTSTLFFYVGNVSASARFYADLLGREPVEKSASFALFIHPSGLALGLWGRERVRPVPVARGGGSELGFKVKDAAAVDAIYDDWLSRGAAIAMPPTDLDFGRSFVALDPDGHRLRVYAVVEGV